MVKLGTLSCPVFGTMTGKNTVNADKTKNNTRKFDVFVLAEYPAALKIL